jgi:hypothetical protein
VTGRGESVRIGERAFRLALVAAIAGSTTLLSCDEPARVESECRCSYTTDTDVPGVIDVVVCSEPARASAEGADCATALGVGHVERCACETTADACAKRACGHASERRSLGR